MQWLNAFIAALKRPINCDTPAYLTGFRRVSRGVSAFALPTSARPTPDVTRPLAPTEAILARSAQERRNRKQAAAYIAKNMTLIPHKER
jgi:hypothetical protein